MEKFVFKWKRRFFWNRRTVVGFKTSQDRMQLFYEDGGVEEVPKWSECHCQLGADFFRMQKRKMEKEAGQKIPMAND